MLYNYYSAGGYPTGRASSSYFWGECICRQAIQENNLYMHAVLLLVMLLVMYICANNYICAYNQPVIEFRTPGRYDLDNACHNACHAWLNMTVTLVKHASLNMHRNMRILTSSQSNRLLENPYLNVRDNVFNASFKRQHFLHTYCFPFVSAAQWRCTRLLKACPH